MNNYNLPISVIIPMYNCEEYVPELLQSMINQTFSNFEIICVNDGSTDRTLELIQAFSDKDSRIKYINQKNTGAGGARNAGIEMAKGKYLMFLDSDDIYYTNMLEEMYSAAEKYGADEVFCLYEEYNYKDQIKRDFLGFNVEIFPPDTLVETSSVIDLFSKIGWAPWNALFRRSIIDKYNLRFSGTKVANDVFFIHAYAAATNTIIGVHKKLLKRRRYHNANSLTSQRWKYSFCSPIVETELYRWIEKNNLLEKCGETCRRHMVSSIGYNGGFPLNNRYIEAYTKMICEETAFKNMDPEEFYKKYWVNYDSKNIKVTLHKIINLPGNEVFEAQRFSNVLVAAKEIEKLALEKYGRVLNPQGEAALLREKANRVSLLNERIRTLENKNKELDAKLKEEKKKKEKTLKDIEKVKSSWNFRTGYYVTWIPKKVYYGILGGKRKG